MSKQVEKLHYHRCPGCSVTYSCEDEDCINEYAERGSDYPMPLLTPMYCNDPVCVANEEAHSGDYDQWVASNPHLDEWGPEDEHRWNEEIWY